MLCILLFKKKKSKKNNSIKIQKPGWDEITRRAIQKSQIINTVPTVPSRIARYNMCTYKGLIYLGPGGILLIARKLFEILKRLYIDRYIIYIYKYVVSDIVNAVIEYNTAIRLTKKT